MKSGLEDRNNTRWVMSERGTLGLVSMKSGLEDRNNSHSDTIATTAISSQ